MPRPRCCVRHPREVGCRWDEIAAGCVRGFLIRAIVEATVATALPPRYVPILNIEVNGLEWRLGRHHFVLP